MREPDYKRYAKRMQGEIGEIPLHFAVFIILTDMARISIHFYANFPHSVKGKVKGLLFLSVERKRSKKKDFFRERPKDGLSQTSMDALFTRSKNPQKTQTKEQLSKSFFFRFLFSFQRKKEGP